MLNLHPNWTQLVYFCRIAKLQFFNWTLSVLFFWCDRDPSLSFRDDLHHFHWLTVRIFVSNVFILGIIEDPHKVRRVNMILRQVLNFNAVTATRQRLMLFQYFIHIFGCIHVSRFVKFLRMLAHC